MTDSNRPLLPTERISNVDANAPTEVRSERPGPSAVQATFGFGDTGTPPPARTDYYVGRTIDGRYLIESVLGEGGMGIVYRGRHRVIDKKVAIKVLRGDMAKDKEITERFLQEARAASSIGNAHIIDISDFGQLPDGSTYFVMEFLEGDSLSHAIDKERPTPVPRLLHIAKQIVNGLGAAHAAGIVHRDLKPDNVMLIDRGADHDFVKILDFGIAKVGAESKITRAGSVFGTPHYMSPEQAAGTSVDLRTDVYALGVILYEMASGKVPFDADNFMGILTQHMYKAPVPILATVPPPDGVPPGLDAVIQKCLSKKAEQRYPTMAALGLDLDRVEKGLTPEALPEMMARSGGFHVPADYFRTSVGMPAPVPGMPPPKRRTRWGVYAGVASTAAMLGVVFLIFMRSATTHANSPGEIAAEPKPGPAAVLPAGAPSVTAAVVAPALTTQVLLSVEPMDSKVTRDGQDLGALPIALALKQGETASVVITRAGFKTLTVSLDSTTPRMAVKMERVAAGKRPSAPKPTAPPSGGTISDFQDPFLKK